jgi:hypothetical protein
MRVQAAAADPHDRAGLAPGRQGADAKLPGDRGGMRERVIEGTGHDVQTSIGRAGIRRAQRVELLDGSVGVDHDEGAGLQAEPFDGSLAAEHELDHLLKYAD